MIPALLALLVLLAAPALADAPAGASPSETFAGVWQFDRDRSDSQKPMLEALELPWFARMAMSRFTPTMRIRAAGEGLHVVTSTPIGADRKREMPCDGSQTTGEDPLGRAYTETTRWQGDGTMLLQRKIELDGGRAARIEGTWRRSGEDLLIQTVVRGAAGVPVQIRRLFRPVPDDAS